MTTRTEIIAQLDAEIGRLQRARDFLVAAFAGSKNDSKTRTAIALASKATTKAAIRKRKEPASAAARITKVFEDQTIVVASVVAPPPPPKEEPQVHRVPPRRRMERRHLQTDRHGKSGAALSGQVPTGPVVVSANEARKVQERAVPAPPPIVSEPRPEIGAERSLGSLIQAFERRAGLSGLETP
jgi:hypothetical protein